MIKIFSILLCLISIGKSYGQPAEIYGKVMTKQTKTAISFASISLLQDTNRIMTTSSDQDGNYRLFVKVPGTYTLEVRSLSAEGQYTLNLAAGMKKELDLFIPDPCEMVYPSPVQCPMGQHTNHIIPILYGLPVKKSIRKAKRGKIILGGCMESCEKYYCKIHKKAF